MKSWLHAHAPSALRAVRVTSLPFRFPTLNVYKLRNSSLVSSTKFNCCQVSSSNSSAFLSLLGECTPSVCAPSPPCCPLISCWSFYLHFACCAKINTSCVVHISFFSFILFLSLLSRFSIILHTTSFVPGSTGNSAKCLPYKVNRYLLNVVQ